MNILDFIVIGILTLFVFLGARRGFMDEILGITGWIIAIICAVKFGGTLAVIITRQVPQLHMVSSVLAGLLLLFGIRYAFLLLIGMIKKTAPALTENSLNKIAGAILGFVQGILLISILILLLWVIPFGNNVNRVQKKSVLLPHMEKVTVFLVNSVGNFIPYTQPMIDKLYDRIDNNKFDKDGLEPKDIKDLGKKVNKIADEDLVDKDKRNEMKKAARKLEEELRR